MAEEAHARAGASAYFFCCESCWAAFDMTAREYAQEQYCFRFSWECPGMTAVQIVKAALQAVDAGEIASVTIYYDRGGLRKAVERQ